jgi:hypothetical protein
MIRALPILAALPTLAACDIENLINPGKASREAYEYRQAGLIQTPKAQEATNIAQTPIPPTVEVAETAPEVVEVVAQEPVYVPPEPQKPICQAVYAIFNCGPAGEIIWL